MCTGWWIRKKFKKQRWLQSCPRSYFPDLSRFDQILEIICHTSSRWLAYMVLPEKNHCTGIFVQLPLPLMIPEQGPLHASLNAQEDVIQIYHFFFYQLYRDIFATELPKKPKPFRVQLLLMSVLFGWRMIRDKVIRKFDLCKDMEYACILHILDEVVPLAFFPLCCCFWRWKFTNVLGDNV